MVENIDDLGTPTLDDHFGLRIAVFESAEAVVRGCPLLVGKSHPRSRILWLV